MDMNFIYETKRLQLRILNGTNAEETLQFYLNDRELFEKYEPARARNFYTEEYHRYLLNYEYNLIIKGTTVRYWIYPKDEPDTIIGTISLRNIMRGSYQKCEMGYKLSSAYQHRGLAREAIRKVIDIAFFDMDLHRIEACCMPENLASIRLLESLNFQYEGMLRSYAQICGRYEDHLLFSLLRP